MRMAAMVGCSFSGEFMGSIQLKLFAKAPVEHSSRNKAAESAQDNALADRVTQLGRCRGQRNPHGLRDHSRSIAAFGLSFRQFDHTLSFRRVNIESYFGRFGISANFGFRVSRF